MQTRSKRLQDARARRAEQRKQLHELAEESFASYLQQLVGELVDADKADDAIATARKRQGRG